MTTNTDHPRNEILNRTSSWLKLIENPQDPQIKAGFVYILSNTNKDEKLPTCLHLCKYVALVEENNHMYTLITINERRHTNFLQLLTRDLLTQVIGKYIDRLTRHTYTRLKIWK